MSRSLRPGLPVSLAYLGAEVQKVFEKPLLEYAEYLRVRGLPQEPKMINDPIWHTIRVESWELAILDSPLIQRLRNIRQLGLAGLVYPAAGYSRFEHTIGTLYQTQRVVEYHQPQRSCATSSDTARLSKIRFRAAMKYYCGSQQSCMMWVTAS